MLSNKEWRLVQAMEDIQEALSALTFFMDVPKEVSEIERRRFRCYHDIMVVSYWRPFSNSEGLPKLSLNQIGLKPTNKEKSLHSRIGQYRNKLVAHTDRNKMRIVIKGYQSREDMPLWPLVAKDLGFEFLNDQRDLENWLRKLRQAVSQKVFELVQDLPPNAKFEIDFVKDADSVGG